MQNDRLVSACRIRGIRLTFQSPDRLLQMLEEEGCRLFDLSRANCTDAFEDAPDIRRLGGVWKSLGAMPLSQSRQTLF